MFIAGVNHTIAINHCHGFQVIAGDVDTSDQFITGASDQGV
jgi:hypothetical protein